MIATFLKWFGAIALCLVLQTTLVRVIAIGGITPDLLIIALFLLGIKAGVMPGIYVGFLLGLGQDLYTPSILGQNALAKTITGGFIGLFNEKMIRTDPIVKVIILLVAFLVHDSIFTMVTMVKIDASAGLFVSEILKHTLPRAVYSMSLGSLIYIYTYFINPSLGR